MIHLLFILGMLGLITSTIYATFVVCGIVRYAQRQRTTRVSEYLPPISVLKPLHGPEHDLEVHLESFYQQDYPLFEIIFCAQAAEDSGLTIASQVAARHPHIRTKFLSCGSPSYPNAKVWSLEWMQRVAEHGIFVVSDSDVSVTPDYLRAVVAPMADDRVGLVTCLYRGVASRAVTKSGAGSFWSSLEAVGMSVEMSAGVLVAEMFEGMRFALGATMVVRRRCLDRVGGFAALGEYHADDFMLGNLIAGHGHKVVLSTHVVEHHILNASFISSARHQIRWMRSTRFSRPKGHFGTVLTYSVPYGLLTAICALVLHQPVLAAVLFGWSLTARVALAILVGSFVVRERHLWRGSLLYPIRDLLGFFFWGASYFGSEVRWRGRVYQILRDGRMRNRSQPADRERLTVLTM